MRRGENNIRNLFLDMGRVGDAKTVLDLQPNSSISVAYHPDFGPRDDLLLLEIDEKLIPDVLNER